MVKILLAVEKELLMILNVEGNTRFLLQIWKEAIANITHLTIITSKIYYIPKVTNCVVLYVSQLYISPENTQIHGEINRKVMYFC